MIFFEDVEDWGLFVLKLTFLVAYFGKILLDLEVAFGIFNGSCFY
jgi:hypothetical protein